jgi:hypothetical protein
MVGGYVGAAVVFAAKVAKDVTVTISRARLITYVVVKHVQRLCPDVRGM